MEELKFYELKCKVCGGNIKLMDGNMYRCTYCGAEFESRVVSDTAEKLRKILSEQKMEIVVNLRQQLWAEMHADNIDSEKIVSLSREIKKYLPKDFYANFCEIANCGNRKEVNTFLNAVKPEDMRDFADAVLDFMIKSLETDYITSVGHFIERAYNEDVSGGYKGDPEKYEKYSTWLNEEAEKLDAGVYDISLSRDVFLAYSSKDMDKVIELCDYLESKEHISCFLAMRNLRHGRGAKQNYDAYLKKAIENCRTVVFVSSTNSRSSGCDAVRNELSYIKEKDISAAPPQYRYDYSRIPLEYKMPRVEYLIEGHTGTAGDKIVKEFFDGLEWCRSKEDVAAKVTEHKAGMSTVDLFRNSKMCANEGCGHMCGLKVKYCPKCGGSAFYTTYSEYKESQIKYCDNCGAENDKGNIFCTECGRNKFITGSEQRAKEKARKAEEEKRIKEQAEKDYNTAWSYYNKGNHAEAVKYFRKAAEQGKAEAQCQLGYCYDMGIGVDKNETEAVKWYRKAAEQGDATAQYNLAIDYRNGIGVEKSDTEGVKWYRKAAEQGHANAQNNLGYCYESGVGVDKNINEAVKWYRKAAEQSLARAQYNLGLCYEYATGVTKDMSEAVRWYRKAAKQGHENAKKRLTELGETY